MANSKNEHYCKVCGERKSNENFSGKGHANHICKKCSSLSATGKAEAMTLRRLKTLPARRLTEAEMKWLVNRTKDKRETVRQLAKEVYAESSPHEETTRTKK